jgi:hypothetical protein
MVEIYRKQMGMINPLLWSHLHLQNDQPIEVSLYIISTTHLSIKQIDLKHLSLEKRLAKLQKWAKGDRFVAIIEKGDQVYAHVSPRVAKALEEKHQSLNFHGKEVEIKSLSEESYKSLSKISEAFIDLLARELDQGVQKDEKESPRLPVSQSIKTRYYVDLRDPIFNSNQIVRWMIVMRDIQNKAKSRILRQMQEDIIEQSKQNAERAKKKRIENQLIDRDILKRQILSNQINQEQIKSQIIKVGITQEDVLTKHLKISSRKISTS